MRGFTLIEIIVVITIMAIMAALIVPRVVGRTDDARIAAARQDIATLTNALKLYRLDNGRYPTTEQGLRALVEKPTVDPIPTNWKADYTAAHDRKSGGSASRGDCVPVADSHLRPSTVRLARRTGSGGAKQCFAKPRLRPPAAFTSVTAANKRCRCS